VAHTAVQAAVQAKWWLDEEQLPGGLILGGADDSFSEGQQDKFGVNASGKVQDEAKFKTAVEKVKAVRMRMADKLKVMTISDMGGDQWIPESKLIMHLKGFGGGLNGDLDKTILEDIMSSGCGMMVWDGDSFEETGFTKMVPQFLESNPETKALAFALDYELDDFKETWEPIIEKYPDRIRVVTMDMKPPAWRDAADHGITEELKDTEGLPEWAQEYFLVGRLANKVTGSKQVFSLGGGGIAAHEAKASANSGVEWTVYALSRGRDEAHPTLADWAAENPSSSVKLKRDLDPDENKAFSKVENRKKADAASATVATPA